MSSPDEDAFFDTIDGLPADEEEEKGEEPRITTDVRLVYESNTRTPAKLSGIFDEVEGVEIEGPADEDESPELISPEDVEMKQKAFSFLEEGYKDRRTSDLTRIDEEEDVGDGEHISGPAAITSESENTKSESGSSSGNSAGRPALFHFLPKISLKNPFKKRSVAESSADKSDPIAVKTSTRRKRRETKDMSGLKLSQAFAAHAGACWCMKVSISGKYLATCGQDAVVHVWSIPSWTLRHYARESQTAGDQAEEPGKRETEQDEWSPDVASGN